ncbi:hypothetical protein [Sulfitobacter sp. HGT1]|uniref:hypothetical protein n=1 Tax=Sulfitobacter sp. HGT1 TaxID=2735435 RepID=UPI0020CF77C2|nr:hypothetical protein [Sulfitobacter sp. HGT1]
MAFFSCIVCFVKGGGLKQYEATMVETHQQFGKRVNNLNRKHKALANGYYTTIRNDGLVIARPRRRDTGLPVKYILALVVLFVLLKAFMLSANGPGTYQIRLNALSEGTAIERAGAWILQVDPVTQALANKIGPVLRGDVAKL